MMLSVELVDPSSDFEGNRSKFILITVNRASADPDTFTDFALGQIEE